MKKLESIIFYLLIFSIPIQTRLILHNWTQPFNQWASAYLYGTDILLAAIFILWLARNLRAAKISNFKFLISKQFTNPKSQISKSTPFWLTIFFVVSAVSIFNSRIVDLSFYQLLKLAEFIGFYFYLRANLGKVFSFRGVLMVIIASGLFQSMIAIAQYIKQGSIGLRLLGESPLSVNATGVAVFIADGVKYLRAYGTTPHPNILAAWLFVAIFAFYFLWFYPLKQQNQSNNLSEFNSDRLSTGRRSGLNYWSLASIIVYAVLLFGLFFTFSRVIIGLWLMGIIVRLLIAFFKKDLRGFFAVAKKPLLTLVITTAVVTGIFSLMFWPQVKSRINISAQEEAVTQRVYYNKIAGSVAAEHPLMGVGIGQFVPNFMSKFKHLPATAYQPVHNVYLLITSETGFLGLSAFLLFLFSIFWRFLRTVDFSKLYNSSFLIFTFSFLLIGFFDHFLWTSQQGSLIFWMALALLNQKSSVDS